MTESPELRVEDVLSGQFWEKVVFASGNDKVGSGNEVCPSGLRRTAFWLMTSTKTELETVASHANDKFKQTSQARASFRRPENWPRWNKCSPKPLPKRPN
jgi:UDP-N-acetylglucosamine pyrophosphorylase